MSGGGTSTDDTYAQYDCGAHLWRRAHSPILFSDGGNFLLGISRLVSFLVLYGLNSYNRRLLLSKTDDNTNVIPNLILPYYFSYFKLFIFVSFVAGVLDLAIQLSERDDGTINNWLVPIEQGFFHWLYEGLAFFLMRYGSGLRAMKLSLFYSSLWGSVSFVVFFIIFSMLSEQYGFRHRTKAVYGLFISYDLVLFLFYLVLFITPNRFLYRRDALRFYAGFNVIYYLLFIVMGTLLFEKIVASTCVGSIIVFVFVGFLQPIVLFRTLQIDSQYWQGLKPDPRNPMLDVWDHVDISTAQSMAENMDAVANFNLPVLHFGLLEIEKSDHFVPGGFSRVYFGSLRGEKVALKILFAMELTPMDVDNFYAEATLLHSLRHPNVVECKGICTMPPALAMVLENCQYGSLFDFLYKPITDESLRKEILNRRGDFNAGALSSLQAAISSGPPAEVQESFSQSSIVSRNSSTATSVLSNHKTSVKSMSSIHSNPTQQDNDQTNGSKKSNKSSSLAQALSSRLSLRNSLFRPSDSALMAHQEMDKEQELTVTNTNTAASSLRDSLLVPQQQQLAAQPPPPLSSSLTSADHDHTHNPIYIGSAKHQQQQQAHLMTSVDSSPQVSVDSVESSNNLRASTLGIDISTFQHHAAITGNDRLTFTGTSQGHNRPSGSDFLNGGSGLDTLEEGGGLRQSQLSSIDMDEPSVATATAVGHHHYNNNNNNNNNSSSSNKHNNTIHINRSESSSLSRYSASSSNIPLSYAERSSYASSSAQTRPSVASRALGSMALFVNNLTGRQSVRMTGAPFPSTLGQGLSMFISGQSATSALERESLAMQVTMAHTLTMHERIMMMRDAIAGIAFLHSKGFLHCDVKSLNFLVDKNYRVKVADLGEARRISALGQYEKPPSPARNWIPPEIVPKNSPATNYTAKSEVYAVCIVAAELALLELPFGELPERVTLRTWYDKLAIDRIRPILPPEMPVELRNIVELGMETEPDTRPTITELLSVFDEYLATSSSANLSGKGSMNNNNNNNKNNKSFSSRHTNRSLLSL